MSRNDLFVRETDQALASDEIQRGLSETKSITQELLRDRCLRESDAMWAEVGEGAKEFDAAAKRFTQVETLGAVGSRMWNVATSWLTPCLLALLGVVLVVFGYLRSVPGVSGTTTNDLVLLVAVSLLVSAAVFFLMTAAGLLPLIRVGALRIRARVNPVLITALGAASFYLGAVRVVQGDQVNAVQGADEASWLAFASLLTGCLVLILLFAGLRRKAAAGWGFLGVWVLAAIAVIPPLGFFLVSQIESVKVLTAAPDPVFVVAGEIVLGVGVLVVLVGWGRWSVPDTRDAYERCRDNVAQSLTQNQVLPFLRGEIAKHVDDYAVRLEVRDAPGLSQVFDVLYRVPTTAAGRVNALLNGMPGGSIGLAGSRGAGKTTLMESYCLKQDKNSTLATMVAAPVEYSAREFLLHLYAKVCLEVLGEERDVHLHRDRSRAASRRLIRSMQVAMAGTFIAALGGVLYGFSKDLQRLTTSQWWGLILLVAGVVIASSAVSRQLAPALALGRRREFGVPLETRAADRLEEIRYQQTYTTTATGTVKLPVGVEGALSKARGLTRQPMHLPEIVDSLKGFLAEAAHERGRVVIGIDELDKMKSEKAAEQFLNEIKGIFGIKNVYFLVSVSEEAMSTFERRGLPFRDVFDSTFDEIVWFDHLSTVEATATIDRRVLVPIPFKQLCFTLSGGLPRDLIRVVRMMLDAQEKDAPTSLSAIALSLVKEDVRRKTRAVTVAARRLDAEPHTSRFLAICDDVARREIDQDALARLTNEIVPDDIDLSGEATRQLCRLIGELAGFYYYAATLLEFFDNTAPEERWRVAGVGNDDPRELGTLATARQAFATSPSVAWRGVSRFRQAWGLTVAAFPAGLSSVQRGPSLNGRAQARLPFRRKQRSTTN